MKNKKIKILMGCLSLIMCTSIVNPIQASAAWKQNSKGWWNTEGNSYSTGWRLINGSWYYFGQDGYMKTGWVKDNNTWYYLEQSGAMKTGWLKSNDTWYYLEQSGAMKTGWLNLNGTWYYLESSGAMKTGWLNLNGTWYYTNESGAMQTGLNKINNTNYYFDESGVMLTGPVTIDGIKYTFDQNGAQITSSTNNDLSNNDETIKDTIVSGGGGGGGSTSSGTENVNFLSYSDLNGQWIVSSYLENTGISTSLTGYLINSAIGQVFTVDSSKIETSLGAINNPTVKEQVMTNAEFKSKWGVNLSNLGISGSSINCITLTGLDDNNVKRTGYVIVDSNDRVFALVKGTVFRLERN